MDQESKMFTRINNCDYATVAEKYEMCVRTHNSPYVGTLWITTITQSPPAPAERLLRNMKSGYVPRFVSTPTSRQG